MKISKQVLCNVLALASLAALPAMAADGNVGATVVSKGAPQVCTRGGACKEGRSVSMKRGGFGPRLKLSDDQLEKIAALKNQLKTEVSPEVAQLKSLKFQLKDEMMKPEVNKEKALSLESNINSIKADIATKGLNNRIDRLAVLTPEQKEILRHKMLAREAFGGQRFHQHGGRSRAGFERGSKA